MMSAESPSTTALDHFRALSMVYELLGIVSKLSPFAHSLTELPLHLRLIRIILGFFVGPFTSAISTRPATLVLRLEFRFYRLIAVTVDHVSKRAFRCLSGRCVKIRHEAETVALVLGLCKTTPGPCLWYCSRRGATGNRCLEEQALLVVKIGAITLTVAPCSPFNYVRVVHKRVQKRATTSASSRLYPLFKYARPRAAGLALDTTRSTHPRRYRCVGCAARMTLLR